MIRLLLIFSIQFLFFNTPIYAKKKIQPPDKIKNTIIIYLENHSFYNLFAHFPGADNEISADYKGQLNEKNEIYKILPPVVDRKTKVEDSRFPKDLPNKPFKIDQYIKLHELSPDPKHEYFTHQLQINGGKNDRFVLYSGVRGLSQGYYDMQNTYLWSLAKEFVLADQFYQSAFGGSFLNHQWLIASKTPEYKNAPDSLKTYLNKEGVPEKSNALTEDGFAVNTIQPFYPPYNKNETEVKKRLPPLTHPTIGDRLNEKKITWAWYAGGWNNIIKDNNPDNFQFHHQPFVYYKNYAPGTTKRKTHLKDEDELFLALESGQLPEVAFYKPVGKENTHPGYADISSGILKVQKLIETLKKSKLWKTSLVIITFDEHGGFWDPKPPQKIDRWGLGTRIPALFISPLVKKGFVDHTPYETVSILSFLEKKYSLEPLSERDRNANPLNGIWTEL